MNAWSTTVSIGYDMSPESSGYITLAFPLNIDSYPWHFGFIPDGSYDTIGGVQTGTHTYLDYDLTSNLVTGLDHWWSRQLQDRQVTHIWQWHSRQKRTVWSWRYDIASEQITSPLLPAEINYWTGITTSRPFMKDWLSTEIAVRRDWFNERDYQPVDQVLVRLIANITHLGHSSDQ